jgi:hypothetical protein
VEEIAKEKRRIIRDKSIAKNAAIRETKRQGLAARSLSCSTSCNENRSHHWPVNFDPPMDATPHNSADAAASLFGF